jgi:hypothetical protein
MFFTYQDRNYFFPSGKTSSDLLVGTYFMVLERNTEKNIENCSIFKLFNVGILVVGCIILYYIKKYIDMTELYYTV